VAAVVLVGERIWTEKNTEWPEERIVLGKEWNLAGLLLNKRDDNAEQENNDSCTDNQTPLHVLPPHLTANSRSTLAELDSTLLKIS